MMSDIGSIQGPVWVAWREGTLTRAEELEALCDWEMAKAGNGNTAQGTDQILVEAIQRHLNAAREAATKEALKPNRRLVLIRRIFRNGPLIERAQSNLDAAEAQLLNLAPARYILGQMPCLLRHVQCHLPPTDPARREFERITRRLGINDPDSPSPQNSDDQELKEKERKEKKDTVEAERGTIVTAVRAASSAALRERVRLRNFRNVVVVTAVLMAVLAIGVAITGFLSPTLIPLCFAPEASGKAYVVCPTAQSATFPAQPGTQVADIDFLDMGGFENISVNGSPMFTGDISAVPGSLGGAAVSVSSTPAAGGKTGLVTLAGAIQKLRVGGQEFWINNVCAME